MFVLIVIYCWSLGLISLIDMIIFKHFGTFGWIGGFVFGEIVLNVVECISIIRIRRSSRSRGRI